MCWCCAQEAELQLADCCKLLSEARSAAAEAGSALAAERAARLAAEDREAGRQSLMDRLSRLKVGGVGARWGTNTATGACTGRVIALPAAARLCVLYSW